jgi:hypothetical protein
MYHVGSWFSVSDFLISQEVGWFTSRMVFNISFGALCIWSSIMKFICCLLPSSRIWFFILQDRGAMVDPRPWTYSSGLASLSLSQSGTAMGRPWWWWLAMYRLMSGVETMVTSFIGLAVQAPPGMLWNFKFPGRGWSSKATYWLPIQNSVGGYPTLLIVVKKNSVVDWSPVLHRHKRTAEQHVSTWLGCLS